MDGFNTKFAADPQIFLNSYSVDPRGNGQNYCNRGVSDAWTAQVQHTVYLDMVPYHSGKRLFKAYNKVKAVLSLDPPTHQTDRAVSGYYFPYIFYGAVASEAADHIDLQYLRIPREGTLHKFAFTGALCGCNIVVLAYDDREYEVVHYPNSDGKDMGWPLLGDKKDRILATLDYDTYAQGDEQGNAFVFLHYNRGWKIFYQPLRIDVDPNSRQWIYRRNQAIPVDSVPVPW
jgi:hypothetical protein